MDSKYRGCLSGNFDLTISNDDPLTNCAAQKNEGSHYRRKFSSNLKRTIIELSGVTGAEVIIRVCSHTAIVTGYVSSEQDRRALLMTVAAVPGIEAVSSSVSVRRIEPENR